MRDGHGCGCGVDDRKEANRIVGNVVSMLMQQAMKGEKGKNLP